jgi:hypothetical protein
MVAVTTGADTTAPLAGATTEYTPPRFSRPSWRSVLPVGNVVPPNVIEPAGDDEDTHAATTVIPSAARISCASTGHRFSGAHAPASVGAVAGAATAGLTTPTVATKAMSAANTVLFTAHLSTGGFARVVQKVSAAGSGYSAGSRTRC